MGDVLYYILTKKWTFERQRNRQAIQRILEGRPSDIPKELLESTDPAIQAMIKAIQFSWIKDPDKRPSSREIANFFKEQLTTITGNHALDYRVLIPPLPPNYDYSDRDFQNNFKVGVGA